MNRVHSGASASIPGEKWEMPVLDDSRLWAIGVWLSAALDDPDVCDEMTRDIREWFDNGGYVRRSCCNGSGLEAQPDGKAGAVGLSCSGCTPGQEAAR